MRRVVTCRPAVTPVEVGMAILLDSATFATRSALSLSASAGLSDPFEASTVSSSTSAFASFVASLGPEGPVGVAVGAEVAAPAAASPEPLGAALPPPEGLDVADASEEAVPSVVGAGFEEQPRIRNEASGPTYRMSIFTA